MRDMSAKIKRVTVPDFTALKNSGRKISMLTAYDFPMARTLDQLDVDGLLVGDSLGMVVQGRESTVPVTLDEIIYHAEMVGRAVERALVVCDMPFLTYQVGLQKAIENAGRILKETRCQAVKLEGSSEQADTVAGLVAAGIPVMAHLGLRPQSINQLGSYRVQRDAEQLMRDALAVQDAGAFAIVLECIPTDVAGEITRAIQIPTIGIGAGNQCDGQVLVTNDLLGLTNGYIPRFVKKYADMQAVIGDAVGRFRAEVESGEFPGPDQSYK